MCVCVCVCARVYLGVWVCLYIALLVLRIVT